MILAKDGFACRSFVGSGGAAEHYILVEAPANVPLATQIDAVERRYADALASLRLSPESAVFRRLYASDILNQAPALRQSRLHDRDPANPVAVSMIQQAPLGRGKIAVIAYHDAGVDAAAKRRLGPKHIEVRKKDLGHLWSTRLCTGDDIGAIQVEEQTRQIFGDLCDTLATRGATLADHCVRTWIYVKDVDVFYDAMVKARRALFADHGMTKDTHFIASTGIEGACAHRYDLVSMDAYSVIGLKPDQVQYLNDFSRLSPTALYGVTFERGTRIAYADRAHHFISGTASIDNEGKVVFPGDVLRQLGRTLENVEALLASGGAALDDMTHLIVYLRDPDDQPRIRAALGERFPGLPVLVTLGAVCRPEWLVEVEGIAIAPHDDPALPAF